MDHLKVVFDIKGFIDIYSDDKWHRVVVNTMRFQLLAVSRRKACSAAPKAFINVAHQPIYPDTTSRLVSCAPLTPLP